MNKTLLCLLLLPTTLGCGGAKPPAVDDGPFRAAIVEYLRDNNMALAIKEIKTRPTIDGDQGRLSASLTHQELGGPSVTWEFRFARQADGNWIVTGHED